MNLLGKFRGCLLGGLIGDSFGAPFEWDNPVSRTVLTDFLTKKLSLEKSSGVVQILPYTDDTEMARSVSESLIVKNGFEAEDMAKRFADEYFKPNRPKRSYGTFVTYVFKSFKEKSYEDVFDPARAQFEGAGSFGNGAAMRTHPVALFCHNKSQDTLFDVCRKTAQLTHAHLDGYNGAILQTLAVRCALNSDPNAAFDSDAFLDTLYNSMKALEEGREALPNYPSFCSQIDKIRKFLPKDNLSPTAIGEELGNHVTATKSVPTAIYTFLKGMEPVKDFQSENPFLRTLYLSILIGGDTDTIASMACSISGAFYGMPAIPEVLHQQCEASEDILKQADRLAKLVGVL